VSQSFGVRLGIDDELKAADEEKEQWGSRRASVAEEEDAHLRQPPKHLALMYSSLLIFE